MASSYSIGFDIFAKDAASKVFSKLGDNVKDTEGKFSKFKAGAVAGAAVAATAITGFAAVSVNKFKSVAGEVAGLQKTMGGTPEQASRMRFAANMTGVSFETLQKSTSKFAKTLDGAKNSQKATAAMTKVLGTNFLDAHGHMLPMDDLLLKVSDKFKAMPAGSEKTALAMKLFGKSGTDMLPFLNKGSSGLSELAAQSDKYGLTLSGKNLQALKDSKLGQREWNATLDGLKVQLGAQVLPIMTKFAGLIRDKVIPVVQKVTQFLTKHASAAKLVGLILITVIAGMKVLSVVMGIVNAVMDANPIGLVVIALAALAVGLVYAYQHCQTFRAICQAAFKDVMIAVDFLKAHWKLLLTLFGGPFGAAIVLIATHFSTFKNVAMGAIRAVVDVFMNMVGAVVNGAASAFGWVPHIGGKLKSAAASFNHFRDTVNSALNSTKNTVDIKANTYAAQASVNQFLQYVNSQSAQVRISAETGARGGRSNTAAVGTPSARNGTYLVGEKGPELVHMNGGESVMTASRTAGMLGGGGITLNLTVQGSVVSEKDLIRTVANGIEQIQKRLGAPTIYGRPA